MRANIHALIKLFSGLLLFLCMVQFPAHSHFYWRNMRKEASTPEMCRTRVRGSKLVEPDCMGRFLFGGSYMGAPSLFPGIICIWKGRQFYVWGRRYARLFVQKRKHTPYNSCKKSPEIAVQRGRRKGAHPPVCAQNVPKRSSSWIQNMKESFLQFIASQIPLQSHMGGARNAGITGYCECGGEAQHTSPWPTIFCILCVQRFLWPIMPLHRTRSPQDMAKCATSCAHFPFKKTQNVLGGIFCMFEHKQTIRFFKSNGVNCQPGCVTLKIGRDIWRVSGTRTNYIGGNEPPSPYITCAPYSKAVRGWCPVMRTHPFLGATRNYCKCQTLAAYMWGLTVPPPLSFLVVLHIFGGVEEEEWFLLCLVRLAVHTRNEDDCWGVVAQAQQGC